VVRTDASGHFHLPLPAGYPPALMAAKAGYLQAMQPARNPQSVRIDLKPEAVIAGRIVDEDGFPAGGANIQAMRYQVIDGRRQLVAGGWTQSDERGEYRIDGLQPGRYYLHVYSNDAANWDRRNVAQYPGGTLQPDDRHAVELKTGETRKDTDIQLIRFEGVTVSGRVEALAASSGGMGPMITLSPDQPTPGSSTMGSLDRDGSFTIRHVPPGTYTLRYGSQNPRAGELSAQVPVEVADHDVRGLALTPHAVQAIDLEGQVKLREGGSPGGWYVYLRPQMGYGVSSHTEEDGSFVVKGLLPEHYAVQATPERRPTAAAPSMGHVVSIMLGDLDVQEKGFDLDGTPPQKSLNVLVSNRYAMLTGTIVDPQGAPVANARIYFQSSLPGHRGYAVTDDKGNFRAILNEAGDYRVFAVNEDIVTAGDLDDYESAHLGDFPLVHVVLGDNPPVRLVRNPPR